MVVVRIGESRDKAASSICFQPLATMGIGPFSAGVDLPAKETPTLTVGIMLAATNVLRRAAALFAIHGGQFLVLHAAVPETIPARVVIPENRLIYVSDKVPGREFYWVCGFQVIMQFTVRPRQERRCEPG